MKLLNKNKLFNKYKYYIDDICNINNNIIISHYNIIIKTLEVIKDDCIKNIVIHITDIDDYNKREYTIYYRLKHLKGFIKHTMLYDYINNIKYMNLYKGVFDNVQNTNNIKDNYIIISKYIKEGSINNFLWTIDNIKILKSILKQGIISLMHAVLNEEIVFDNLHYNNILLKKTKKESIKYGNIEIKSEGYKIIIDCLSISYHIDNNKTYKSYWNSLSVFLISGFYYDKLYYKLDVTNIKIIEEYLKNAYDYHPDKTIELLDIIDKLVIQIKKDIIETI